MSNFGKIKNIWKLDAVSRSEYEESLKEFDDALTEFDNKLNTLNQTVETNSTNIVDLESKHNAQQTEINNLSSTKLEFTEPIVSTATFKNGGALSGRGEKVSSIDLTKPVYVSFSRFEGNSIFKGDFIFVFNITGQSTVPPYRWGINSTKIITNSTTTQPTITESSMMSIGLRFGINTDGSQYYEMRFIAEGANDVFGNVKMYGYKKGV